jgi:hypothetical protein
MLLIVVGAIIISLGPLFGQGPTLTGAGYAYPVPIRVAPGQITTLFVTGLKTVLPQPVKAMSLPLPNSLAGISVTITQPVSTQSSQSYSVPLLAVQQILNCNSGGQPQPGAFTPDCLVSAVTVQIPYEIVVPGGPIGPPLGPAEIVVAEGGAASKSFLMNPPVTDNLHVLTTCDAFPPEQVIGNSCNAVVTHADGTLVTAASPAKAGEEIVIYAFGLGQTSPAVKTGAVTPTPAPVLAGNRLVYVQFDFRPNAAPSPPYFNPLILAPFVPGALFAGLTPGQVGLYQINVRIPSSLPALGSCSVGAQPGFPYNNVLSNLTIDLSGLNSFDGAAICVAPMQ